MTAAVPGGIQLVQISSQRTHPGAEDVRPSAADDISNNLPTVSCSTNDFSDGNARRDKTVDRGCDLVPAKKPIVLPSLRITQERPIDLSPTDGTSDQRQRLACRIEEGRTGIFHEVPSIGDLHGVRAALIGRLPVGGAAITCDHPDRWPVREPRRNSRRFAVRQNVNDAAPLEIADDGSIAMTPPPGPIINPHDSRWWRRWTVRRTSANQTQYRLATHRHGKSPCQACTGCTTGGEADMTLHFRQPVATSGMLLRSLRKALSKDLPRTAAVASKPTRRYPHNDRATM